MSGYAVLGYAIEEPDFKMLRGVEKALHGDGTILTSDRRRDLANLLTLLLDRVEALVITEEGLAAPMDAPRQARHGP